MVYLVHRNWDDPPEPYIPIGLLIAVTIFIIVSLVI